MTYRFLIRDSLKASNAYKHLAAPSNGYLMAAGPGELSRRCADGPRRKHETDNPAAAGVFG
jgi:hypothetical protein